MRNILIATLLLLSCSCNTKDKKETPPEKYVYVSTDKKLHTRRTCIGMDYTDKYGNTKELGINFIEKKLLQECDFNTFCHWCVKDKDFEEIKRITTINKEQDRVNRH